MRLFAASSFEPAFVDNLKAVVSYARDNSGRDAVKWVDPLNFHITYAFLGDLEGPAAAKKGIDAALEGVNAFTIASGGFGVFPSSSHPSVLWVGIGDGAAELRELARRLAEGLASAGLMFEERFEPHITIGRVKAKLPENFLRRTSDYAQARRAVSRLASVELMESGLTAEGPVYRQVYSKRLLSL